MNIFLTYLLHFVDEMIKYSAASTHQVNKWILKLWNKVEDGTADDQFDLCYLSVKSTTNVK